MYTFGDRLKSLKFGKIGYVKEIIGGFHMIIDAENDLHITDDFDLTLDGSGVRAFDLDGGINEVTKFTMV